jgi:hypothetical protein
VDGDDGSERAWDGAGRELEILDPPPGTATSELN